MPHAVVPLLRSDGTVRVVVLHGRCGSTTRGQIRTTNGSEHNRDNGAVLRLIKYTKWQHTKYHLYALLLSYILLLHRFSLKSQEQHASPQKPRNERTNQRERDLGRNLVPWQEGVVGNDPTRRNASIAVGDGDPARFSDAVLGQEREKRHARRSESVWGSWNSPCPLLTPTCSRQRGTTACHCSSTT